MKIGTDLDGNLVMFKFLNPSIKLPQWIYLPLAILSLLLPPNPVRKKFLQSLSEKHEIIIISARPKWFERATKFWLDLHRVPYKKVFCVGFGKGTKERKLNVIQKEGIRVYIEDDKRIIRFLNRHSIKTLSI